jgi:2-oxoisovalerate dehydrogenase E1 component
MRMAPREAPSRHNGAPLFASGGPAPAVAGTVDWRAAARLLLTSRALDDLEERELVPAGRVRYQFSARGHELGQILLGLELTHPHDAAAIYYRSRPLMLALGLTPEEALAGSLARSGSVSGGRDIGVVFNMPSRGGATVLPMTGDVGGQYSPAAGWAQAIRYRQRALRDPAWDGAIAVAAGGDGSVATPGFWAALNAATTQHLPLLFLIEDNGYAISVPSGVQVPGGDIAANLASYQGLLLLSGDGTDPATASELLHRALDHVRGGSGPALVRLHVPRLNGHSFNDNQAYKSAAQQAAEWERDPLARLRDFLAEEGWSPDEWDGLAAEAEREVRAALERALTQPEPELASATRFVFCEAADDGRRAVEGASAASGQRPTTGARDHQARTQQAERSTLTSSAGPRINMVDAIRMTLASELRRNPLLLVFGEDVGQKGGVHGATRDLQAEFGPERVFDTALNEESIIGRAVGMALNGLRPVPEIQFRKYADPAMEQIVDCGALRWRTNNHFAAPVVVRMPVGFSKITGDPWHSVCGEAIYAHTPGWRIAMPADAADAVGLLRAALRGDDPVFFLEHRALLDTPEGRRPYPGDDYVLPFGQAALRQAGDALTVVTWGAMVPRCIEAAAGLAGVEILDLRTLIPWDREAVLGSVRKTGRCLVVHEDTWTCGFGAEIAATVAQEGFAWLDAPVTRVAAPDCPVPYNNALVAAIVPTVARIRAAMEHILQF